MATITLNNITPTLQTGESWIVKYLKRGSTGGYITAGPFTTLPIIITTTDPAGTEYEGVIQTDCGNGIFSNPFPFSQTKGDCPQCPEGACGATMSVVKEKQGGTLQLKATLTPTPVDNNLYKVYANGQAFQSTATLGVYTLNIQDEFIDYSVTLHQICETDIVPGAPETCGKGYLSVNAYSGSSTVYVNFNIDSSGKDLDASQDTLQILYKLCSEEDESYQNYTTVTKTSPKSWSNPTTPPALTEGTCYDFKVDYVCEETTYTSYATLTIYPPCVDNNNPGFKLTTQTSFDVRWDMLNGEQSYTVRVIGPGYDQTQTYIKADVTETGEHSLSFTGMTADTTYSAAISKVCPSGSTYNYPSNFTNTTNP